MNAPHRIRLRPPWQRRVEADRIAWVRRFGRPTNLGADERVWLVVDELVAPAAVVLNGRPLGRAAPGEPAAWDITTTLNARNELRLELALQAGPGTESPAASVALEIRSCGEDA